jgi:hypothetical protein
VTTIIYKKGNAETKVDLPKVEIKQDSASLNILAYATKGGNSPFFGKITATIFDKAGNNLFSQDEVIAIYRDNMTLKFSAPIAKLPEGSYTAEIKLSSERTDISQDDLLKTASVEKTIPFAIQ